MMLPKAVDKAIKVFQTHTHTFPDSHTHVIRKGAGFPIGIIQCGGEGFKSPLNSFDVVAFRNLKVT